MAQRLRESWEIVAGDVCHVGVRDVGPEHVHNPLAPALPQVDVVFLGQKFQAVLLAGPEHPEARPPVPGPLHRLLGRPHATAPSSSDSAHGPHTARPPTNSMAGAERHTSQGSRAFILLAHGPGEGRDQLAAAPFGEGLTVDPEDEARIVRGVHQRPAPQAAEGAARRKGGLGAHAVAHSRAAAAGGGGRDQRSHRPRSRPGAAGRKEPTMRPSRSHRFSKRKKRVRRTPHRAPSL